MKNTVNHKFSRKRRAKPKSSNESYIWSGLVIFLIFAFTIGTPIGQSALGYLGYADSHWTEMTSSLDQTLDKYDGEVGIYIKDLRTGKVYERQADQRFLSASLIKLPIMAATFQAIREGKLSLDSFIKLKRRHKRGGSGSLKWARLGNKYPVSSLIYKMITRSDNTATAVLIDEIGYPFLNRSFDSFNLKTTRIDPVGMSLADHIHPARDNYTTPREMGELLERIYNKELVSDGLSDLMLEILKDANSPTRLAQFLPNKWSLARKTGLLRKNCHDVGIVFTERGDYVICVLTRQNNSYKKAKGLIASVGKTAYSYLSAS